MGITLPKTATADSPADRTTRGRAEEIGVPRRFGAGTLLIVVAMYGVLFRCLVVLGADWLGVGLLALFATAVATAQAALFGGTRPRDASILAGMLLCPVILLITFLGEHLFDWIRMKPSELGVRSLVQLGSAMIYLSIFGAVLGYLVGCAAAGVFFVHEHVKRMLDVAKRDASYGAARGHSVVGLASKPSALDRYWDWLKLTAREFSPIERKQPLRAARNTFLVIAALLVLAVPFFPPGTRLAALAVALLVALLLPVWHGGAILCGWRTTLVLLLIAHIAALGPALMARNIYLGGNTLANMISDGTFWTLYVVMAIALGLSATAFSGWLDWFVPGTTERMKSVGMS